MSITWKISTVLILASALVFGVLFGREYMHNLSIHQDIAEMEAQKRQLEQEHSASLSLISQLSREYYVESEARLKQGLAAPGESEVIVTNDTQQQQDDTRDSSKKLSNPEIWFAYFFAYDLLPRATN